MKLREIIPKGSQAGKTLIESAIVPEVLNTLKHWIAANKSDGNPGVLIGGIALSFYAKPRYTEDIDLLFINSQQIPSEVVGFKKHRQGALLDKNTHVEIKTVTPESVNVPASVFQQVINTAKPIDGLLVASLEGLIVLKLHSADTPKRTTLDSGDIIRLLDANPNFTINDLSGWNLSPTHINRFTACYNEAHS